MHTEQGLSAQNWRIHRDLDTLDEAAWSPATRYRSSSPDRIQPHKWTGAHKGHAFFAYADSYLMT
jgi:hypothetical protein